MKLIAFLLPRRVACPIWAVTLGIAAMAWPGGGVVAQTTHALTLKQAQAMALENSFAMQYVALDREKADRDVKEVLASGLPQVNLVADYSQYIDIPTQVAGGDVFGFPDYLMTFLGGVSQATGVNLDAPNVDPDAISEFQFGQSHAANVGVQASQLVFSGAYIVGVQASKLFVEARDRAIERTADEVRRQVAEAYHLAVGAEEALTLAQQALALVEESAQQMAALNAAGFTDGLAVDRLALAQNELEIQVLQTERQVLLSKALLAFQIGLPLGDSVELKDDLTDLMRQEGALDWASQPFDPSALPMIQEQELYAELARLDVMRQKASGWPQIGAFYTNQGNAQRDAFNFFDSELKWYPIQLWGVNVSMPLFTSFGGKQQLEKKRIEERRAQIGLAQMTQGAWMEFENAKANFTNATALYQSAERGEAIAQKIYDQSTAAFNEGVVSSFEWNESRNGLLQAQGNRLSAALEWLNARVALQAARSAFE